METETTRMPSVVTAERWLQDWLLDWRPGDQIPEAVTIARLQAVMTALEDSPTTEAQFWVAIEPLFKLGDTFGLPTPPTPAVQLYWRALQDLPVLVVVETVETLVRTWKWGNRLPLPAEVREQVPKAYLRRLKQRASAKMALSRLAHQIAVEACDATTWQRDEANAAETETHWALWRMSRGGGKGG
jgi:hypothetical protein